MNITHYFKFPDETTAKNLLTSYWFSTDEGWTWNVSCVDAPVPVVLSDGITPDDGYHLNLGLPELDNSLVAIPGFIGALDENKNIIAGSAPHNPQRVFM